MNAEEFRTAALRLPGAVEAEHMNHPDFRVKGRIFASLGFPDECWGMVKLTPAQQHSFIERAPGVFKPCNGAWGERGATNVQLASAKQDIVSAALQAAFQNVASPLKNPVVAEGKGQRKSSLKQFNRATAAHRRKRQAKIPPSTSNKVKT